jgi:DNA-binding transcriptional LysR family regulator
MELHSLKVFQTVATETSFSRAAEKLLRTQPAVSLAVQRLEAELGERLIDRSGKELLLTDAGKIVFDYSRRFENLELEMGNSLAEMRDNSAGFACCASSSCQRSTMRAVNSGQSCATTIRLLRLSSWYTFVARGRPITS